MTSIKISLIALTLLSFIGCNAKEFDEVTNRNLEHTTKISLLRVQKDDLRTQEHNSKRLIANFEMNQGKESKLLLEVDDMKKYERNLAAANQHLESELANWKLATRRSLVGEVLNQVRLTSGETIYDAKIIALNDETVQLKHTTGESEYAMEELSGPIQQRLVYEPTLLLGTKIKN